MIRYLKVINLVDTVRVLKITFLKLKIGKVMTDLKYHEFGISFSMRLDGNL